MESPMPAMLALGDSYTIGEGVAPDQRWPIQLQRALHAAGIPLDCVEIVAGTGWTTDELRMEMDAASFRARYDLVCLLIGVNNQYRGYPLEVYAAEFSDLLRRAIRLAGDAPRRVIVLSIPDWSVTPFAQERKRREIRTQIDQFNSINQRVSDDAGVNYIDVTDISRRASDDAMLLAADGLHPSATMYGQWVERLHNVVARILTQAD
jgi:lysophospholipase L1-like esterase